MFYHHRFINSHIMFDTDRPLTVYISDKAFGSDDVVAVSMLQLLFDQIKIIRTCKKPSDREEKAVQTIWVNLTLTYEPLRGFFDSRCGPLLANETDDTMDEFGIGFGICGQIWKAFGRLLLEKFGADDDDSYVYKTVYREFLQPLDYMSKSPVTQPGSFVYALNIFNSIGDDDGDHFQDAVASARAIVSRILKAHTLRGNMYMKELAVMEAAFTDRKDQALLVLPVRCESVHLFLKDYDPSQEVKFIIQPRNEAHETWQVWAVDYKRRRFHIDIPLLPAADVSIFYPDLKIRSVHPARYQAITSDRYSAILLAQASMAKFSGNYIGRLRRWWFDL